MTTFQKAYIAGLIDGDGSIMLQLKPNIKLKYLFRPKAVIVIYQDAKHTEVLIQLQKLIGAGYVYERNDRMAELRIEGLSQVSKLLTAIQPFILFKCQQVSLALKALIVLKTKKYSILDFLVVCQLADEISQASYTSKLRKYTAAYVAQVFFQHKLLPVTTGSLSQTKDKVKIAALLMEASQL